MDQTDRILARMAGHLPSGEVTDALTALIPDDVLIQRQSFRHLDHARLARVLTAGRMSADHLMGKVAERDDATEALAVLATDDTLGLRLRAAAAARAECPTDAADQVADVLLDDPFSATTRRTLVDVLARCSPDRVHDALASLDQRWSPTTHRTATSVPQAAAHQLFQLALDGDATELVLDRSLRWLKTYEHVSGFGRLDEFPASALVSIVPRNASALRDDARRDTLASVTRALAAVTDGTVELALLDRLSSDLHAAVGHAIAERRITIVRGEFDSASDQARDVAPLLDAAAAAGLIPIDADTAHAVAAVDTGREAFGPTDFSDDGWHAALETDHDPLRVAALLWRDDRERRIDVQLTVSTELARLLPADHGDLHTLIERGARPATIETVATEHDLVLSGCCHDVVVDAIAAGAQDPHALDLFEPHLWSAASVQARLSATVRLEVVDRLWDLDPEVHGVVDASIRLTLLTGSRCHAAMTRAIAGTYRQPLSDDELRQVLSDHPDLRVPALEGIGDDAVVRDRLARCMPLAGLDAVRDLFGLYGWLAERLLAAGGTSDSFQVAVTLLEDFDGTAAELVDTACALTA